MNKKIPKIYVNKIDKNIDNNKQVYYSFKETKEFKTEEKVKIDYYELQNKIDELFRSNDFIYKKKFIIKTKNNEQEYTIISKSFDYLLTIDGFKIFIEDIFDIRNV